MRTSGELSSACKRCIGLLKSSSAPLRKATLDLDDLRYSGKATSRKALHDGDQDEDDSVSVGSEEDDDEGEDAEASEMEEDEAANGPASSASEDEAERPITASAAFAQDERAMVKQLKQAASGDVEKGRDIRKQLVRMITQLQAAPSNASHRLCGTPCWKDGFGYRRS